MRLSIQNVSFVFDSGRLLTSMYMPKVPHTVLCRPHRSNVSLDRELRDKLETHFKILFSNAGTRLTAEDVRPYVHKARMDQWGKVRRAFGGDTIQSVMAMQKRDNCRDSSFVRVSITFFRLSLLNNHSIGMFHGDYEQG
jgi:hypothetical protein